MKIDLDTLIDHLQKLRVETRRGDIPVDITNLPELSFTTSENPSRTFQAERMNDPVWIANAFKDGVPQLQYLITFDQD